MSTGVILAVSAVALIVLAVILYFVYKKLAPTVVLANTATCNTTVVSNTASTANITPAYAATSLLASNVTTTANVTFINPLILDGYT